MGLWLALWAAAAPAGAATFDSGGADGACAGRAECEVAVETLLRDAGFTLSGAAVGLTPGVSAGPGFVFELSGQSLARPVSPSPNLPPALPYLGLGAVFGRSVRVGVAALGGGAPVALAGFDPGWTLGGRLGVAVGAPAAGRWFGLDLEAGHARSTRAEVAERGEQPFGGATRHLLLGADTVMVADVDRTSFLTLRLGARWESARLEADTGGGAATLAGLEPRATLGAGYRPHPNGWVSAGVRVGLRDGRPPVPRLPWSGSISVGWRIGARAAETDTPAAVPVVAAPAPVSVRVPQVKVVTHPDLDCGAERLATGAPPPAGDEAWCVDVTADGRVVRDGPALRWHPEGPVAERGQYADGLRDGAWVTSDPDGRQRSSGRYQDDVRVGRWTTWTADGALESEGDYIGGKETGTWVYHGPDGVSRVVGDWVHGQREGRWLDYGPTGRVTRERMYREGRLVYSMMR